MTRNPKNPWAVRLAEALKTWCDTHGYAPRLELSHELEISSSHWEHIMKADVIIGDVDPTVYARLWFKTGLTEADPRTIPDRVHAGVVVANRAWSDGLLQGWLEQNHPESVYLLEECNVRGLIVKLIQALVPIRNGNEDDRDRLINQCGLDMGALLVLLELLTMPAPAREEAIRLSGVLHD